VHSVGHGSLAADAEKRRVLDYNTVGGQDQADAPAAVRRGGQDAAVVMRPRLLGILWVVIGLALAVSRDYLEDVDRLKEILSAVLAVFLWPLLLLGIDLHVR
jgi:hypothetical protein